MKTFKQLLFGGLFFVASNFVFDFDQLNDVLYLRSRRLGQIFDNQKISQNMDFVIAKAFFFLKNNIFLIFTRQCNKLPCF